MPKTNQHRDDILFDSFNYFMKLWGNGKEAFFNVRCTNGRAWMSFNTLDPKRVIQRIILLPAIQHQGNTNISSKRRRNQAQAEAYRERKRQEAERSTVENNLNDT